ncbi:MAG: polymorphic toxin-type HINT domain-containing protein, partial [Exilibacterium sp.]
TGGKFANGADTQTFLVTQSPTMDMEAGASDVKGIDISNLLIDLSLEVIPGGGLYKCSRDGCDAWDWVGATVDLVPGFGKVGKLFKLRKLVARKPRITIRGCSFAAGTLVATAVGTVAIEDIEVGDFVLAKNEESGEVKARRVNSVFADRHDSVISLVVRDEEGNQEVIITTEEHPFYVAESGWVTAGDVVPGTYFEALDGDRLELVGKEVIVKPQFAYNFEVDEYHTYGVGKAGVWVHNDCENVATKRPGSFRKKTVKDSWDNAADGTKPGTKQCPTCGKDVEGNPNLGEKRNGPNGWDNDHQPKWKDRDLTGMDRKQVLDEFNKDTRLRCPSCNRADN